MRDDLLRSNFFQIADNLTAYIEGKVNSLDEAFGLVKPKKVGAPIKNAKRDARISRKVLALTTEKGTKRAIQKGQANIAVKEGLVTPGVDTQSAERLVRSIYKKNRARAIGKEIATRLKKTRAKEKRARAKSVKLFNEQHSVRVVLTKRSGK